MKTKNDDFVRDAHRASLLLSQPNYPIASCRYIDASSAARTRNSCVGESLCIARYTADWPPWTCAFQLVSFCANASAICYKSANLSGSRVQPDAQWIRLLGLARSLSPPCVSASATCYMRRIFKHLPCRKSCRKGKMQESSERTRLVWQALFFQSHFLNTFHTNH